MYEKSPSRIGFIIIPIIVLLLVAAAVSAFLLHRNGFFDGSENVPEDDSYVSTPYEQNDENNDEMNEPEEKEEPYEPEPDPIVTVRDRYDRIVWLDAGHGGADGGTSGTLDGVRYLEKDVVLQIVLKVYELFERSPTGIRAFLVRSTDVYIHRTNRAPMWNETADLVVSVHLDYFGHEDPAVVQSVAGIRVYYPQEREYGFEGTGRINITDRQFAQIIQGNLARETGARDRGIHQDSGSPLTIFENSTAPIVLIEAGFMSNTEELTLLTSEEYQWRIARAIYNSVVEAFRFQRNDN